MTKLKTQKKIQKPIDLDCHFKYRCHNKNCINTFWLSLAEAQTKNFKIVCDCCGVIFYPKRIKKIKIIYPDQQDNNSKPTQKQEIVKDEQVSATESLYSKCIDMMIQYGFSYDESVCLVTKGFDKTKETEPRKLIKYILQNLGEFNECN